MKSSPDPSLASLRSTLSSPGLGDANAIRVISYDRILPRGIPSSEPRDVSEAAFIRQIELLDQWGYRAITFDDVWLYEEGKLNLPLRPVILTFNGASAIVYRREFSFLRSIGMRAVVFALGDQTQYAQQTSSAKAGNPALMTEHQMLEMVDYGFEFGSLGVSGTPLTELPPDAAWQEVSRSRMTLEFMLSAPVRSFAYPLGKVNDRVKQLAAEAGYRIGCTLNGGPRRFGSDPYEVRRVVAPDSESPLRFALAMRYVPLLS